MSAPCSPRRTAPLTPDQDALLQKLFDEGANGAAAWKLLSRYGWGSRTTVYRKWKRHCDFGSVAAYRKGIPGKPRLITPAMADFLLDRLAHNSGLWMEELQEELVSEFGLWVSTETVRQAVKKMDLTNKISQRIASQRNAALRAEFHIRLQEWSAEQLVYVDETYISDKVVNRKRGWSLRGSSCINIQHLHYSTRYTVCPAYTVEGWLPGPVIKEGSLDQEGFNGWLESVVLPQMNPFPRPKSVLILDNCATHNKAIITTACRRRGVLCHFLPPYSPDYNPIELSFRLFKQWLRRHWKTMPVRYGEPGYDNAFLHYVELGCDMWGRTIDHAKLFRRCHVRNGEDDARDGEHVGS